MPSSEAIRKEIRITQQDNGKIKLDFEVKVSPSGMVEVNGQPVGDHRRGSNELGWVAVFEHFSLQMIELRKRQEKLLRQTGAG